MSLFENIKDKKKMDHQFFPQVVLLGNGINQAYGCCSSWDELIKSSASNSKFSSDPKAFRHMPLPLKAVLATNDHIGSIIKTNKDLFHGPDNIEPMKSPLSEILALGADSILTTNYSYELEQTAIKRIKADGINCYSLQRHTPAVSRAEARYMLHTYNEVEYNGIKNKIWHIHGESRKPDSIILGHYWYGILLSGYHEVLRKKENTYKEREIAGEPQVFDSWLDEFIMGDVYSIGFGFNLSEMDLWWLVNRKAREKAKHGKLYVYSPHRKSDGTHDLLEAYGAEIVHCGFESNELIDYKLFYNEAISDIKSRIADA